MTAACTMRKLAQSMTDLSAPFSTDPPMAAASGCSAWAASMRSHQSIGALQWSSVMATIGPRLSS
jgi:hypothetical protein